MVHPLSKPHSVQKLLSMLINTCKDCFFILFKLRCLLCQKALCQSDILKRCVLWKKIKLLKHHTKMQPLFAKLRVFILARFGSIKKAGGLGIPTVKPWNVAMIREKMALVKDAGAFAAAMDIDGVKLDFPDKWVHLRKSNTEPIIALSCNPRRARVYTFSKGAHSFARALSTLSTPALLLM